MADALLVPQVRVVTYIYNFLKNTKEKKSPATLTAPYYEARLKLLERYFNEMYERHQTLSAYAEEKKEHDYFKKNYFVAAEDAYVEALADINSEIERLRVPSSVAPKSNSSSNNFSNPTDHVKVPRVTLPIFSGKPSEWESFKQRFSSLIVNKREHSEVDK